ncbi:hypothetical protein CL634_06885 [bacterium]|nr:hypothetical protein [bacterium]|tara:strand:- start:727 stop:1068 length:342 start_codon:yes stop_codon:yes gene_type:complete
MKKMSLEDTWYNCLKMWKWIAGQIKKDENLDVDVLKEKWLKKYKFSAVHANCFFCEYIAKRDDVFCRKCPGCKVDKEFDCRSVKYYYFHKPVAFYEKLVELNKIREKSKKNKK